MASATIDGTSPANGRYQFILLGEQRAIVCEQLAQSRYVKRSGRRPGLEVSNLEAAATATSRLQVQR